MQRLYFIHPKDYSLKEVLSNARIGLEFGFLSSKETSFIIEDLGRITGKAVSLSSPLSYLPSWSHSILVKEFEGESPRYRYLLAPQDYKSLDSLIPAVLEWIGSTAKTDDTMGLRVSLSFNERDLKMSKTLSHIDLAKMSLAINEEYLYNRFQRRKNSPYCFSSKKMEPLKGIFNSSDPKRNFNSLFFPPNGKNYGIDFTDSRMGVLHFNYIGGQGYEENIPLVKEALQHYIISTYQALNNEEESERMVEEVNTLLEGFKECRRAWFDPSYFIERWKGIKLSVDLNHEKDHILPFWSSIREELIPLLFTSGIEEGKVNWDSDRGILQMKGIKSPWMRANGIEIVDSEIAGDLDSCSIWNSRINLSKISNSTLVSGSSISRSLLERVRIDYSNSVEKSIIENAGEIVNGEVKGSLIKNAGIGRKARLDEGCTLVGLPEKAQKFVGGIETSGEFGAEWMKKFSSGNSGFGNEFKNKW